MSTKSLTDADYDRLEQLLNQFGSAHASNLEKLDGFFAALICGPVEVHPSDYLPELWKGEATDKGGFSGSEDLKEFVDLISRHWSVIAHTLALPGHFVRV